MSDWLLRPRVEANLLNPALIGMSIAHAAAGYREGARGEMPWPVAFLIPPLILHRPTRDALPSNTRTHFAAWVSRHPLLVAGYPRRAQVLVEPTREALRLAIRAGRLNVANGGIVPAPLRTPPPGEVRQLLNASRLVGRWLARLDQPSSSFALLGVAP